jgi:flagellar biosynthetic protein FliO
MDVLDSVIKMGSALMVVLGVLALLAVLGRRWGLGALHGGATAYPIRMVASLPLGSRRSVHVLEVGEKTLVIGATTQHLVLLTQFDHEEASHTEIAGRERRTTHMRHDPVISADDPSIRPYAHHKAPRRSADFIDRLIKNAEALRARLDRFKKGGEL